MNSIKKWFLNSSNVTKKSSDEHRSVFDLELKIRSKITKEQASIFDYNLNELKDQGVYKIMGQNPDDPESCYIGNVTIEYEDGIWLANWSISGFSHYAYGMQVSPNILVFNFTYLDNDEKPHRGLVSYTFITSSIVRGVWIEEGYSSKGFEELRKLDEDEIEENDIYDSNFGFSLN